MDKYTAQVPLFGNPYQELTPSSCLCSCHALGRFIPIVASWYNENTLEFVGGGEGEEIVCVRSLKTMMIYGGIIKHNSKVILRI